MFFKKPNAIEDCQEQLTRLNLEKIEIEGEINTLQKKIEYLQNEERQKPKLVVATTAAS